MAVSWIFLSLLALTILLISTISIVSRSPDSGLHCTKVMWLWPQGGHCKTGVWIISPVSVCRWSGLACPWLSTKGCPTLPKVHVCPHNALWHVTVIVWCPLLDRISFSSATASNLRWLTPTLVWLLWHATSSKALACVIMSMWECMYRIPAVFVREWHRVR